jgi:Lon protease-like protein
MPGPVSSLSASELAALPIFPLPNATLFPLAKLPLHVFEPRYREMVRYVLDRTRLLAVARLKPGFESNYAGRPPVHEVCGVGRIVNEQALPDGRYNILLEGIARVRILEELPPDRPFRLVRAEALADSPTNPLLAAAWQRELSRLWNVLGPHLPPALRELAVITREARDAGGFADCLAAAMIANPEESQRLLEELDPGERLRLLVAHLTELADSLSARSVTDKDLN